MNNFLNQIQALNREFSESERKWLTEISVLKQREQAIREELQQARRHCELDAVKISEYENRERELQARIESTLNELRQLERERSEREQALSQQLQAGQEELHRLEQDRAQREKALNKEIAALQSEKMALDHAQQLQAQHYNAELKTKLDEHNRLIEACAALEAQLKAEILSEQQTSLRLRQSLALVQQSLATTHASLTWRMTAPLRTLASIIAPKNNLGPASSMKSETEPLQVINPSISETRPINIQDVSSESIMPSSAETEPSIPIISSTLEELLSYHDQQFVYCAFQTLLERDPDPEGLGYYLGRLRTGFSKMRIVAQLRLSKEGKARAKERKALAKKEKTHAASLPGLDKAIKRYRRGQYPLVGWLFRRLYGTEGNHPTERKLRSIENELFILSEKINHRFDGLDLHLSEINRRFNALESLFTKFNTTFQSSQYLGESNKRFFFNLTTSQHWKAHPVGIIRVERELAKYLKNFINVQFVFWDLNSSYFKLLEPVQVQNILSEEWVNANPELIATHSLNCENLAITFDRGDTFISIGLDWDLSPMHEIAKAVSTPGVISVFACYDLVPILFPEFCVRDGFDQIFKRHFVDMAHCANHIFVDSDSSKKDLAEFLAEAKLDINLPSLEMIPLASYFATDELPKLDKKDTAIINHVIANGEYIIYVSSLEARKNHRLLINIWRDLYRERGDKCPQLVMVGMKGWGVDDLLNRIPRMPVYLAGKLNWLQGVSDDLLIHLYKNCSFSVFPSIYEGWGLAATEAMAFGKVCVVSNNSALVQATQNIMPSYHPFDYLGWKNEIEKLLDNASYKSDLEEKIKSNFHARTWEDFSKEFCNKLLIQG